MPQIKNYPRKTRIDDTDLIVVQESQGAYKSVELSNFQTQQSSEITYESLILDSEPVDYFPLTETSGDTAVNQTDSTRNLILTNVQLDQPPLRESGTTSMRFGSNSTALYTNKITGSSWRDTSGVSVLFWYLCTSNSDGGVILSLGAPLTSQAFSGFAVFAGQGRIGVNVLGIQFINGPMVVGANPTFGAAVLSWTHKGGNPQIALYLNAIPTAKGGMPTPNEPQSTGSVGKYNYGSPFAGLISDLCVYHRELSLYEIQKIYRQGLR